VSSSTSAEAAPFTQQRDFWVLIGLAVVLGVTGGAFGVAFMALVGAGNNWYDYSSSGWMGGHWWWVAVTGAAGIAVGVLRLFTRLPDKTPGIIAEIQDESIDTRLVAGTVPVSAASLVGGASLGPEKALGSVGGGAGQWLAQRRGLAPEDCHVATLSGFAGTFGGVFSSTIAVVLMVLEVARPGGAKFTKVLVTSVVSSSVAFGIYFAVAGSIFLDAYQVPAYEFESWQMLAGVALGLVAAALGAVMGVIVKAGSSCSIASRLPASSSPRSVVCCSV
jgi:H+/Cl- antiporter ClcA